MLQVMFYVKQIYTTILHYDSTTTGDSVGSVGMFYITGKPTLLGLGSAVYATSRA